MQVIQHKTVPDAHRQALEQVRNSLKQKFLERDAIIDALLIALLSKQHILLLGNPGVAKSALVVELCASIKEAKHFQWLLTKFSVPEEIFGPISLSSLQKDKFTRITDGKLPEAHISFLDEIFKANSSILNSFLNIMNERIYFNDRQAVNCPLQCMVAASNELPENSELAAMYDRFLLRYWVNPIIDRDNIKALLTSTNQPSKTFMTLQELKICQDETGFIPVPDEIIDCIILIKQKIEEAGFKVSDRRWKLSISIFKAAAYLGGETEVTEEQLEILNHVLWDDPKDQQKLNSIIGMTANPINLKAKEVSDAGKEAVNTLGIPDNLDENEKAEWSKQASLVLTKLSSMLSELQKLEKQSKKARQVQIAKKLITKYKSEVTKKVADHYNL